MAIKSFKDKRLEKIFAGETPGKGFPADLVRTTERKLAMLDAATKLSDLAAPPSNGLHPLKDDRDGQHAIKVNTQFRLCFTWQDDGPAEVEFTDYH